MKLTGRQVAVGGRSCWELNVVPMGSGQRKESIWVDPERDYLATRFILSHGGLPTYKVDVSYKADSDLGWIPDSWTMVQIHEDGSLLMTAHSKMNEYSINPICDKSDFDVVFPPGTYVQNEKTNTDFIQETGGDVRIVPPNERNRSYEELVSTPGPSGSARLWNWPVATVGGAIVLTGLVLAVRYLKHRRIKDVCCSPKSVPDTKE